MVGYRFEVVVMGENGEPIKKDFSLGPGVLYYEDLIFDVDDKQKESPMFAVQLMNKQDEIMRKIVQCRMIEIEHTEEL